ncbi:hypothetical protein NST20_15355 [Weizmannia sp. FSL W8-0676]|uniref:hypothetical protein n=1 Tax=Heyndrickxia TaxID=2837504 RepID=UPI0002D9615A|nr:hypothetical protein [Heyndrickxia coagulans]MBF8417085.1 hypothetical protein [Heyndrickxia coagulans]
MAKQLIFLCLMMVLSGCMAQSRTREAAPDHIETKPLSTADTQKAGQRNGNAGGAAAVNADIERVREAVWKMDSAVPHSVYVNGKDMWVNVHTEEQLNHRERMKKAADIRSRLLKVAPRYDIHVRIDVK